MYEGIFIAASGGNKQLKKLDVISNNLANLNSTGFKKDLLLFESVRPPFGDDPKNEAARNVLLPPATNNPETAYVNIAGFSTNQSEGAFLKTGNQMDLALEGKGFFEVQTPDGLRYTRKGSFRIDQQNRLVTQNGFPVMSQGGGPTVIDAQGAPFTIDPDGLVSIKSGQDSATVGQLKVIAFADETRLAKQGDGLFYKTDPKMAGTRPAETTFRQGFLENSNVSVMEEMGNMIQTLRGFEAYQTVIQSIDRLDNQSINTLGRLV
jgi:flagellar basal-body rod protein FlgG